MSARVRLLDYFEQYLDYFCQKNKNTLRAKKADLNDFLSYCGHFYGLSQTTKVSLQHWNEHVTIRYVDHLERTGASYSTIARRIATLKHIATAMSKYYSSFANPTSAIKTPKKQLRKHRFLSKGEEQLVRKSATRRLREKDSFIRLRNKALFDVMLGSGLRVEEIKQITASQLDDSLEWIGSVRTKSGTFRNIPLSKTAQRALASYLPKRLEKLTALTESTNVKLHASLPLFPSSYKAQVSSPVSFQMGEKSIWRAIHEISAEYKISPHALRHTYAKRLVEKTSDLLQAQKVLGHSDLRITKQYV